MPRPFALLPSVLLATAAAAAPAPDPPAPPPLELQACDVAGVSALCGSVPVFENRAAGSGRKIRLRVVVLPARARDRAPDPVFFLHGGPGAAASSMAPVFAGSELRERRDIVLVDQRGTGASNPLDCGFGDLQSMLYEMATFRLSAGAADCREGLDADLTQYVTSIAMDDLDDVRAALGAERINLYGGSYGTRAALEYIRRHPDHVRTAVLRGVHPPSEVLPLNFDRDSQAALDALIAACASEPDCARAFPDLAGELRATVSALEESPARLTVDDPLSGGETELEVTSEIFRGMIHYGLYHSFVAARLPAAIHRAHEGDFGGIVDAVLSFATRTGAQLSTGMLLAVVCSEDAPFLDGAAIARESRGTLLGGMMSRGLLRSCEGWPRAELPAGYKTPVSSDVPVLLISGEVDPVTSPRLAARAAEHLPNSLQLVLPGTSHGGLEPGCVADLVPRFVERGSVEGLDVGCVEGISRPPFRLD
jgi:pimeloyl-ACP methyl ester carboxylesterase